MMQKTESSWRRDGDWKARYTRLYSTQYMLRKPKADESCRISFMSNDATPYTSLLMRMRATKRDTSIYGPSPDEGSTQYPADLSTLLSQHSELYGSFIGSARSGDLGGNETLLLDMVRARSREFEEESQDKHLELPRDDISEDPSSEACVHGLSLRMTDRSVSRSRVSRVSTRRDMDIPTILAYQIASAPAPTILEVPELQKVVPRTTEEAPRWSIRRSICPVCSQKWKDKTSINIVKYSGLKRNSSSELPSVIAPARLRASITATYIPKPVAAVDEGTTVGRAMRNTGAAWQLTRARRFRIPKPQMPSPEAAAPPSATAPMARKDLDIRVNRFLRDEGTSS